MQQFQLLLCAGGRHQEARSSYDRHRGGFPSTEQVRGVTAAERTEAERVSSQTDTVPEEDVKTKEGRRIGMLLECVPALL